MQGLTTPIRMLCLVWLLLLAACSSTPHTPSVARPVTSGTAVPAQSVQSAPSLPKAGSGRGAYYKDDGPGDSPPAGLELTLDAEPKVEPYASSGNKPYVVFGKTYTPMLDDKPFSQRGIGSWYGKKFHGQKTSSGELYDMYKMTAAHPTLPIPSYARITNIANGKQVIVKINDRGPFHTNRIVDLSYTAALKLDYLGKGSSELLLERLLPADIEKMAENRKNKPAPVLAQAPAPVAAAIITAPAAVVETMAISVPAPAVLTPQAVASSPSTVVDNAGFEALLASQSTSDPAPETTKPVSGETTPVAPAVTTTPNATSGFYLQFGAFGLRSNAEATFTLLQSKLAQLPAFEIVQQGTLYRLFSGPFVSREDAQDAMALAVNIGLPKPIVVQR